MKYANEIHGPDRRGGGACIGAGHKRIIEIYNQNLGGNLQQFAD